MDFFLKAKAWQLFVISITLPIIVPFILLYTSIGNLIVVPPGFELIIIPLYFLANILLYGTWFWSLGFGINKTIPASIRPNIKFFMFSIIYLAFYIIFYQAVFIFVTLAILIGAQFIQLLLFLFTFYCLLYIPYFIAKNICTYEMQSPAKFFSVLITYLLLICLPIGIWFVQPRINAIYRSETEH